MSSPNFYGTWTFSFFTHKSYLAHFIWTWLQIYGTLFYWRSFGLFLLCPQSQVVKETSQCEHWWCSLSVTLPTPQPSPAETKVPSQRQLQWPGVTPLGSLHTPLTHLDQISHCRVSEVLLHKTIYSQHSNTERAWAGASEEVPPKPPWAFIPSQTNCAEVLLFLLSSLLFLHLPASIHRAGTTIFVPFVNQMLAAHGHLSQAPTQSSNCTSKRAACTRCTPEHR